MSVVAERRQWAPTPQEAAVILAEMYRESACKQDVRKPV